jgi:hypothetical protein
MQTYLKLALLLLLFFTVSNCASLQSVSQTQIPASSLRKNVVKADSTRWVIFFLNFDNDFADEVPKKLKSECDDGQVKGILTKTETYNYFIGLVFKYHISAEGYCIKAKAEA